MEEKKTKRFKGLMIALGVVLTLIIAASIVLPLCLTKSCKGSTKTKTYDITFVAGNCTCEYSQNLIKDVPSGTKVHVDGSSIEINGTTVTVQATPTEGESILHNFTFDHWSVEEGYKIKKDTEISAIFATTDKLYSFRIVATGGGQIIDDSTSATQTEFFYQNAKSYIATTLYTDQSVPVDCHLQFRTTINGQEREYGFAMRCPEDDDFYTYVFDGWYYNGNRLTYGTDMTGDIMIEARYHPEPIDNSYMFDFETNSLTEEAVIIGVKSGYVYPTREFTNFTLPRTYNNYPVVGIKNAVLSSIMVRGTLCIPNTLRYVEELTDYSHPSSMRPEWVVLKKIALERGSAGFKLIDGVLYDYDLTEAITGTEEMLDYLTDNTYNMPTTITHIWRSAFKHIPLKTAVLPEGITTLSKECFASTGMSSFVIPSTVTTIEERALLGCTFESIDIPNSVGFLGNLALGSNENLRSVHFGSGIQRFDSDAFYMCPNIESFTVSSENPYMQSYKGAVYTDSMTTLKKYPRGIGNVDPYDNLSSTIRTIGYGAIELCTFTTLHLPEGVERLNTYAVYSCYSLTSVYLPSTINYLAGECFSGCSAINYMEFAGTVAQWDSVAKPYAVWKSELPNLTQIVCSDGVVEIPA